jgi:hypothetical protein
MGKNLRISNARLNVQIPEEIKAKLAEASALEGKKVSVLVRESIEEKLEQIGRRIFEENMKEAYLGLASENLQISEDFEHADAENLS